MLGGTSGKSFSCTLEGTFQHSSDDWTPEHVVGVLVLLNFCRIYLPPFGTQASYQICQNTYHSHVPARVNVVASI